MYDCRMSQELIEDILKQIDNRLRLSMSGPVVDSMLAKGVKRQKNYGVDVVKLKEISTRYGGDKYLAERLWSEDARELKILATLLYPPDQFSMESAIGWVSEQYDQELREQLCKNLLQELSFADELVESCISSTDSNIRCTGYWLFARLLIIGTELVERVNNERLLNCLVRDLKTESFLLVQSALTALKYYGRRSKKSAADVLLRVADFENSDDSVEQEIFDQLKFEFDYYNQ